MGTTAPLDKPIAPALSYSPSMNPKLLGPLLLVAVVLFVLYRRVRRSFGDRR